MSEKGKLAKAQEVAAVAAAEAKQAQDRLAAERSTAAAVDLSDPVAPTPTTSNVTPVSAMQPKAANTAEAAAAAEASMRTAATAAFTKALADGLSKEEAREVAQKAGKAAFKATMKANKPAAPGPAAPKADSVAPKSAPPLPAVALAADVSPADMASMKPGDATPGFVSSLSRMRIATPEERAQEAEAKAREMADRAERQLKIASQAKTSRSRGGKRADTNRL